MIRLASVLFLSLVACGNAPPDSEHVATVKLLVERGCSCTTVDCSASIASRFFRLAASTPKGDKDSIFAATRQLVTCNDRLSVPVWEGWSKAACECKDRACAKKRGDEYWVLPDTISEARGMKAGKPGKDCLVPFGGLMIE